MNWQHAAKHTSDMNGGGSRACLGQSRKRKAKSALAAAASVKRRKEKRAQSLAMQEQGQTGVGGTADSQNPESLLTSDIGKVWAESEQHNTYMCNMHSHEQFWVCEHVIELCVWC